MKNKLAKLKYLPNNYEILDPGDHVICAVSNKKIIQKIRQNIKQLNYQTLHTSFE